MKWFKRRRALAAVASVAMLALLAPTAANANPTHIRKAGTVACAGLQQTTGYTTGTVTHYPSPSGTRQYAGTQNWQVTTARASAPGGGYWIVSASLAMWSPGTYASCTNIT